MFHTDSNSEKYFYFKILARIRSGARFLLFERAT